MKRASGLRVLWAVGILLLSCGRDEISVREGFPMPGSFTAGYGDMTDYHGPWQQGDAISVFGLSTPVTYLFDAGKYEFVAGEVSVPGEGIPDRYYALSPKAPGAYSGPGSFRVTIPGRQIYCGKLVDPNANILVAVTESARDSRLVFHAAVGYLKVRVSGKDRITSLTLSGNREEALSGAAELTAPGGGAPTLTLTGTGKLITLDVGAGGIVPEEGGSDFVFCLPPMTFAEGYTVTCQTTGGPVIIRETSPVAIIAGRVAEVAPAGSGTSFTTFGLRTESGQIYLAEDLLGPDITVCVPRGTDLKRLTPVFSHDGMAVTRDDAAIESGSSAFNFNSALYFSVKSSMGTSKSYLIHVVDVDLPVVYVSTPGHKEIADRETWIPSTTFIIRDTDQTRIDYGAASVKGRGNASWSRPKKSYGIKLGVKPKDQGVLGLPGHKRWCLIAVQWGYLGNSVGYELARRTLSFDWQPHGRHVELVLNGKHVGTYVLAEQIRIDKNRVNIKSMGPEDITEPKISGGYLLTYDRTFNDPVRFRSKYFNMPVMVKDPDDDDIVPQQIAWIENYINEMEASMKDDARFAKREYANYLDVDTYIDMWFVWELAGATGSKPNGTPDFAGPNSIWFHKDRNGKLKAGPCWDFDSYLFSNQKIICTTAQYYGRLFEDPAFRARVKEKWPEFRASVEGNGRYTTPITTFIDSCETVVRYSAERNRKMWTWTFYELASEYKTIRTGLPAKMDFLEKYINSL